MTAAHCMHNIDVVAYFGSTPSGKFSKKMFVPATNQHIHPLYNATTTFNDIGL